MSKNQQAPDDLELVRTFVNTRDIEQGTEALSTPAALGNWLSGAGLPSGQVRPTAGDLRNALELREALRWRTVLPQERRPSRPNSPCVTIA